jgi:methionyl-tRNA formyltransferase
MLKIGILCSGNIGFEVLSKIIENYNIQFVLTDSKSTNIISFVERLNIPLFVGNPRKGKGYSFIKNIDIDILVSVNYLFIIEKDIIKHSKKLSFNIHGSLLPKFRGRTPHVWAIINGETKTGITAHKIDEGCDTGNVIEQVEVDIQDFDTGASILEKFNKLYFPLIEKVIENCQEETIEYKFQDESKASYNGKRTPKDGEINWNWDSERIINWVRAQAFPYPGAFTYYKKNKIIIDNVINQSEENISNKLPGTILEVEPFTVVKTANGMLKLNIIRTKNCTFETGQKFSYENFE